MRFARDERGQMLIVAVLSMMVLLGFMALATDVGALFYHKRTIQSATDAAALAGALEGPFAAQDGTTVTAAAKAAATQNGYTDGTDGVVVTVSNPPADGPHTSGANKTDYVEVVISQPVSTIFMGLFGTKAVTVSARAVAGSIINPGCVWTLGKTGTDFSTSGSNVSFPKCDVYDDSNSSAALILSGSGNLTANAVGIVGNYSEAGSGQILNGTTGKPMRPTTGIAVVNDPLANLQVPTGSTTGCQGNQLFSGTANYVVSPGCYGSITNVGTGNVTFSGGGTTTINGDFVSSTSGTLSFGEGEYIINGNLSLSGNGPLTGTNVSFYVTGGISLSTTGTISLTAPVSGAENGILFFAARNDTQPIAISGTSTMNLQGIIYAPAAALTFGGGGSTNIYTDMVVGSLIFGGDTAFQSYANINSNSPLSKSSLVE
jgi:Flp pilus assembly protein TadG